MALSGGDEGSHCSLKMRREPRTDKKKKKKKLPQSKRALSLCQEGSTGHCWLLYQGTGA